MKARNTLLKYYLREIIFSDNLNVFFSLESSSWVSNRNYLKKIILSSDNVFVSEDVLNNISTLKELIFTEREQRHV